jgi:uncharacterized protein YdiU (UPF0061 family)
MVADCAGRANGIVFDRHEAINGFGPRFEAAYAEGLRRKLGLLQTQEGDLSLARGLLDCMAQNKADFTLTFRGLCKAAASPVTPMFVCYSPIRLPTMPGPRHGAAGWLTAAL